MEYTPEQTIRHMKKQAKRIKKLTGQCYSKCLHEVSKTRGFRSWQHVRETYGDIAKETKGN